jgi:hypothetical protein
VRRLAVVLIGVAVVLAVPRAGSNATGPPQATAWWQRALTDPPANDVLPELPRKARTPVVDVPGGGLYVANDPSGARAISALRYPATSGTGVLRLQVTPNSLLPVGAALVACAVAPTWEATTNGRWEFHPTLHCERSAKGVFNDDVTEVRFDLGALGPYTTERGVEVAITPADGETALYAIAFTAPGPSAFTVTGAVVAAPREPVAAPIVEPAGPTYDIGAEPTVVDAPEQVGSSALPEPLPEADEIAAGPARVSASIGTDGPGRAVVTALLAALAAAAWLLSGRRRPIPQEET